MMQDERWNMIHRNHGITELRKHGITESRSDGARDDGRHISRNYGGTDFESTEKRLRKGKSEGSLELRPNVPEVGMDLKIIKVHVD